MTSVVSFIFVAVGLSYLLLFLAIIIKDYTVGLISGIAIFLVGIYIAIYNIEGINNLLTQAFGLISIMLGLFVFINTGKEKIEELM